MSERQAAAATNRLVRGVDIDLPKEWVRVEPGGGILLLARPEEYDGEAAPTVLVMEDTLKRHTRSFERYVDHCIAATQTVYQGFVLHLDVSVDPEPVLDITLAADQLGRAVTITQRHRYLTPEHAVVAIGTAADVDWPNVGGLLLASVRSLRLVDEDRPNETKLGTPDDA